jgi:hypothetical protein
MEHSMPSDTRNHSSNQEALLLDQALDAVNQRLHSLQPLAITHKPQQGRNGLIQAIGRARERGVDFHGEYQRLSNEAFDAMGAEPAMAAEAPKPATGSAVDPPPRTDARPQASSAPASAPAPTPPPDGGMETTRLFLDFLEKRDRQLFDLMHTVVTRVQPVTPAHQPSQQLQVEAQLDRLGTAVADLTRVIDANHLKFPRRVS